jgi:hypothetical protein
LIPALINQSIPAVAAMQSIWTTRIMSKVGATVFKRMEMKVPVEQQEVHTAAEILDHIDSLVTFHGRGVMDMSESVTRALMAFNDATCASHADALAFISMSRRLTQSIIGDIIKGGQPDQESVDAADRYMETALAFLQMQDTIDQAGVTCTTTMH